MGLNIAFTGKMLQEDDTKLEVFCNKQNRIFISLSLNDGEQREISFIVLDKETAVKFSKQLRKEISLITEVDNG